MAELKLLWKTEWETGIPEIDRQHVALFMQVRQLYEGLQGRNESGKTSTLLAFLASYVTTHFADEERTMESAGYPQLQSHRESHQEMRDELADLMARAEKDPKVVTVGVLEWVSGWLIHHISVEDQNMARYLRGLHDAPPEPPTPVR